MPDVVYKYTNELAKEKSPYLLQHAHNPVMWRAWNEAAFEAAQREDKPIFLSIGYATCHWCHVMEHESFEDVEVAHILNEHFIPIKVDREERPDIDTAYMEVCQAMTGRGGWPLTIIMMPDKKPFFSGTYFPKRSIHGRAGLLDILEKINGLWRNDRQKIKDSTEYIYNVLQDKSQQEFKAEISPGILTTTVDIFRQNYDKVYGGFNQSPKFPSPHQLCFLLRIYADTGDESVLEMVVNTLTKMRQGGIYDHVGFGFHRYSTDTRWFLPHFEKMLYDQAWLTIAYTEAYQVTKIPLFRQTAEEILAYIDECMTSPDGGFYSAEDADSEGVEGKFYVWSYDELHEYLSPKDAALFTDIYGIKKEGNFFDEASGSLANENIPHLVCSIDEYAAQHSLSVDVVTMQLQVIRTTLWQKRKHRVRPILDDKILTDWNGMMIAALSKAASAFQEPKYAARAEKAWNFISTTMISSEGDLLHRYRDSEAAVYGFLDDYAALVFGVFELYQATGDYQYLKEGTELAEKLVSRFEDEKGGFYGTEMIREDTPFTGQKQVYDGAIPSGNSMAVYSLLKLGTLLQRKDFTESAMRALFSFGNQIEKYAAGFTWLLCSVHYIQSKRSEIIIRGDEAHPLWGEFSALVQKAFLPAAVRMYQLDDIAALPAQQSIVPMVYICEDYHCKLPITSVYELKVYLATATASI